MQGSVLPLIGIPRLSSSSLCARLLRRYTRTHVELAVLKALVPRDQSRSSSLTRMRSSGLLTLLKSCGAVSFSRLACAVPCENGALESTAGCVSVGVVPCLFCLQPSGRVATLDDSQLLAGTSHRPFRGHRLPKPTKPTKTLTVHWTKSATEKCFCSSCVNCGSGVRTLRSSLLSSVRVRSSKTSRGWKEVELSQFIFLTLSCCWPR